MQDYNILSSILTGLQDPRRRRLLLSLSSAGALSFVLLWWASKRAGNSINTVKSFFSFDSVKREEESVDYSKQLPYKVGVNSRFYSQLTRLAPILVPSWNSREVILLISLTFILIARTWLDIWFSSFNGTVVRSVVSRNKPLFIRKAIFLFGVMMWPMSIVNNSLKRSISSLALSFRTRLTNYAHEKYFEDMVYYKLSNLDGRIQNPDQLLTQDIDRFSENLSHLYSDIAKPLVDIALFAYKLGQALGRNAPFYMICYFTVSGLFLRTISPPFGKCNPFNMIDLDTAQEQKLQGEFRYVHSRVITHSEEIAFYSGQAKEKENVDSVYKKLLRHVRRQFNLKFLNGIVDSVFVKYFATMLAYVLLSRPVFSLLQTSDEYTDPTIIMEEYSRNSSYMVNLSQAIGRLLLAGRDLTKFAGYTSRISDLFDTLDDVSKGNYCKSTMDPGKSGNKQLVENRKLFDLSQRGIIHEEDGVIEFKDVPIVTPSGEILVPNLSFRIERGMNCIITGPNGCGKSSLFRILGNLWPLYGGTLIKPPHSGMFYVPQKPYLTLGTLRDQVIYPDTVKESLEKGYTDAKLYELLQIVHLEYLIDREQPSVSSSLSDLNQPKLQGWLKVHDWADVLSGGEKQRIAMARLFYHKPQFAILDECTSAVSVDVEGLMYEYTKAIGITLFTVSHRPSLHQFHDYILRFDGIGGYEFKLLHTNDPLMGTSGDY